MLYVLLCASELITCLFASVVRIVCEFVCSICITIVVYLQMSDTEDKVTDEEYLLALVAMDIWGSSFSTPIRRPQYSSGCRRYFYRGIQNHTRFRLILVGAPMQRVAHARAKHLGRVTP
jgi:hypothetical protein